MRLLGILVGQSSVSTSGGGTDWKLILGIPAAVLAVMGLAAYIVGWIRPLGIPAAKYWCEDESTKFSCAVRNRSLFGDKTISSLALVDVPPLWRRLRHPRWQHKSQPAQVIPFGADVAKIVSDGVRLTKREERTFKGELRTPTGPRCMVLGGHLRMQAQAGSKRSRRRKLEQVV